MTESHIGMGREALGVRWLRMAPAIWLVMVASFILLGMFRGWHTNSGAQTMFFLLQSAIVSGGFAAGQAIVRRRAGLGLALGACVLFLVVCMFFFFPMGPAECQEWVDKSMGTGG